MTGYFDGDTHLDGAKLTDWIDRHFQGDLEVVVGPSLAKRYREWRTGITASWLIADRLLCELSLNLADVPAEVWTQPRVRQRRYTADERREVVSYWREHPDESARAIGRRFKLDPATARRWAEAA